MMLRMQLRRMAEEVNLVEQQGFSYQYRKIEFVVWTNCEYKKRSVVKGKGKKGWNTAHDA